MEIQIARVRISKFNICMRCLSLVLLEKEKSEVMYDYNFVKTGSFFVVCCILWQQ